LSYYPFFLKKLGSFGVFLEREMEQRIVVFMEIGAPTYIASETLYVFPILVSRFELQSKATYLEPVDFPDAPDVTVESVKATIDTLINEFIEKTKKYFATPLRSKTILSRLNHVWEGIPLEKHSKVAGWYSVIWKPSKLKIAPREFTLVWKSSELRAEEPMIPSNYLADAESRSPSPAPEVRTIQIQQGNTLANGLEELEPDFSDTKDSRMVTLEYEAPAHRMEKKKIREAKLRAALAALKAERLAERYYQKYGTLPGDDSSDLSSDSEIEES
jgi:hypothetical protein